MIHHPTWEDRRRLGDGWLAMAYPNPKTADQAEKAIEIVHNGIRALQSTDDLGHPNLNKKAWNMMLALQEKAKDIEKFLKKKARVAKPADAPHSKRGAERRGGSTPLPGTKI